MTVLYYDWDLEKNEKLKQERNISFPEIVKAIDEEKLITILNHPNKGKYPKQKILVVNVNDYAYLVPFIEEKDRIFLKTIIPSRKATRDFIFKKIKNSK